MITLANPRTRSLLKVGFIFVFSCFSIFLTVWLQFAEKTDTIFPSLYYLPIILACLWWDRRGIWLAAFFAALFIFTNVFSPTKMPLWEDFIRAAAFILTAVVVAELSTRRRTYIKELDEKVRERTRELETRNEELDSFASTVSRDLIGPLATLTGYAGLAREAEATGDKDIEMESLSHITLLGNRLVRTVEVLLEYARMGRVGGRSARINAMEVLEEVLQDLRGVISETDIEILMVEGLPAVMIDPLKLKQVFSNLVGNAIKHGGSVGDLRIIVGGYKTGDSVTLYVRDNGSGIGTEMQEVVFEAFQRGAPNKTEGVGLGLSIVKRAVEGWGGRIWLESSPGEGATFLFTIPSTAE